MTGENPCGVCEHSGDCTGCILHHVKPGSGTCYNDQCFLNYDCGCLLSLDRSCKASTAFEGFKEARNDEG